VIVLASHMGVPLVNTFCGGDAAKTIDANWQEGTDSLARYHRPCARQRRQAGI
jgi:sugar phosphate isomerase/epimerase